MTVHDFPKPFRETSPAGVYGYPEPKVEGWPLVDVTGGGLEGGWRVWIGARLYHTARTASNAARVASLLNELARLGALPTCPASEPASTVRAMLEASVAVIETPEIGA